jgi:hypothetical protein
MTDADVIFFENALVLLKESTEIRIIVVIRHQKCWWMTCLSDLFGTHEPTFLAFAPNFHTHPTPEQKVGCQVLGVHPSSRNLGFWISGGHPNFAEKVGYRVSGVPRVQGPVRVSCVPCPPCSTYLRTYVLMTYLPSQTYFARTSFAFSKTKRTQKSEERRTHENKRLLGLGCPRFYRTCLYPEFFRESPSLCPSGPRSQVQAGPLASVKAQPSTSTVERKKHLYPSRQSNQSAVLEEIFSLYNQWISLIFVPYHDGSITPPRPRRGGRWQRCL